MREDSEDEMTPLSLLVLGNVIPSKGLRHHLMGSAGSTTPSTEAASRRRRVLGWTTRFPSNCSECFTESFCRVEIDGL